MLANRDAGWFVEMAHWLLQSTIAHSSRSHNQGAVGNGLGHGFEFFGAVEQIGGADGGFGFAKSFGKWIHESQPMRAEIAHGASGGANVQRIARAHQHDYETV